MWLKRFLLLLVVCLLSLPAFCSDALAQEDLDLMTRAELEQIVLIYDQALISSQAELEQNKQNWLSIQTTQAKQAQTLKTLSMQLEQYETEQKSDKIKAWIDKITLVAASVGITALVCKIVD